MVNEVANLIFGEERALYALSDATVTECIFEGEADGESALKESRDIEVRNCKFALRYPLWHSHRFLLADSEMTPTCRAPLWYSSNGIITGMRFDGVKALRECDKIKLINSTAVSPEFGWRCRDLEVIDTKIESEYVFFESERIEVRNLTLKGKYSFQYTKNVNICDSLFDTKDSFWHAEDVHIENTIINGEYFGWYSKNLTIKNCKITGTQPFCYCENLTLINCELENCDLAFEYSSVQADIRGSVISVKNPSSGKIIADSIGEIISGDSVYPCECEIVIR